MVRVLICEGCGGAGLRDVLERQMEGFEVGGVACLGVCADPVTMATQSAGRATYVFSGLGDGDVADIEAFLAAYLAAPEGWIEDALPLGRLRHCLVTRIPALI